VSEINPDKIEAWMFRVPNEFFALFFSLIVVSLVAYLFSTLNVYFLVITIFGLLIYIRLQQAQYLGAAIRVHDKQFPKIYSHFKQYATRLGISKANLYIKQDPTLNAYTLGLTTCTIVLTSELVNQLTEEELNFVIGHELGHYKAGHTKISSFINPLGSGNIFSYYFFGFWNRKTEYSADRCGLIIVRNIDAAMSALLKLGIGNQLYKELDIHGYLTQIKHADSTAVKFSELLLDHPLITNRIRNLITFWKESFTIKS
jgi:Zn-dependent protease with chaperone function